MQNKLNNLLLSQIDRHFGSFENMPDELKGIIQDISNTYQNFEVDAQLLKNAEEALREREFLMTSLTNAAQDAILMMDNKGLVSYWNIAAERIFGYASDEVIGKRMHDLIAPQRYHKAHESAFPEFLLTGRGAAVEKTLDLMALRKDGEEIAVQLSLSAFKIKESWHAVGIVRDVTESRKMEDQLKESENLQRSLLENAAVGILIIDPETCTIERVNSFAAALIGENQADITGRNCHLFLTLEDVQKYRDSGKEMEIENFESVLFRNNKPPLSILKTVRKIQIGGKEKLLESFVDISEQKKVEETLLQSSKRLEAIISASPDGIGIASLDGKVEFVSDKLAIMYGYTAEQKDEIIGQSIFNFTDPSNHEFLKENIHKLILSKESSKITEYLTLKKDKSLLYADMNSTLLFDSNGNPVSILFIQRDVSKRRQAEEALSNERSLFRTIIDLIPDAVYVKDRQGRKILANPKEIQFAGKNSEAEIIGQTDYDLYPSADASLGSVEDQLVMSTGIPIVDNEGTLIDNNNIKHWLLISKVPLRDVHGEITGLVGVTRDISVRKQTEEKIKLQNSFYNIVATVSEKLIQADSESLDNEIMHSLASLGLFNQVDRSYIFEIDAINDEINNTYEWCASGITPESHHLQAIPFSSLALWKAAFLKKEHVFIESVGDLPAERNTERMILESQSIQSLITVPMYYGLSLIGFVGFDSVTDKKHWSEQVINLLKIYASVLAGVIFKKKTEATLLGARQEAEMGNKAKSEFLANMSHEIRTPLNGVIGFTDLLQKTPLNKIQRQYAENVNTSGLALLGIINDILDFSKIEAGKMELDCIKTDIIELVEQASDIIKYHASKKGLELLLNISHNIPRFALLDPIRLKQILVNLFSNAVKFTQSGEVELKVTFTKKDESTGKFGFSVRDTGIGINDEQQKNLFKAFTQADSSTTRKFGGTGLGLTISNMLAQKMGSNIEIISEPGKGATFFFTIEVPYEDGEKLLPGSIADMHRIMVIDDNDNNRMILEHTFNTWGIEFVGIDNGLSALKVIEHSKPFDLIIVDYHMPYLNGIDTIRMIREKLKLSPEIQPIVLLHSSSDDIELYEECKKLGVRFNLTKPVKSEELLHYLKNIHNQPTSKVKEWESAPKQISLVLSKNSSIVILVAEDVMLNMVLVTTIITQMLPNVTILEAVNGKEAFELAIANNPDLILMDVQMPEMSGLESTVEIRKSEKDKGTRIPIVALTAGVIKGEKEKCLAAGMDEFLTKPIEYGALRDVLGKYLNVLLAKPAPVPGIDFPKNVHLHFDQSKLMESIGNNHEIFNELMDAVPLQFSSDLASLEKAIGERDMENVKIAAHSIKGAALGMCFNLMAELAKEMEFSVEKMDLRKLEELFNNMITAWEQVQLEIKNLD